MKRYSWEISPDQHRVSLWDEEKGMMTKFRFKRDKKLAQVCSECAFAVERTVCNSVLCDGGLFVGHDTRPKTVSNPSDLHSGHAFSSYRHNNSREAR